MQNNINERNNSVIEELKKSADCIYLDTPIKLSRHNLPPVIGPQEKSKEINGGGLVMCNHDNCNCGHEHHDQPIDFSAGCNHRDANGISTLVHIGPAPNRVKCGLCGIEFNLLSSNIEEMESMMETLMKKLNLN